MNDTDRSTRAQQLLQILEQDVDMLVDVIDAARRVLEPTQISIWLFTPQIRWTGRSPIDLLLSDEGDSVLEMLEGD